MKIACIDLGGTAIKSGILENGELTQLHTEPTRAELGGEEVLRQVGRIVGEMQGVERLGVSTCGEVDAQTGVIRLADNIPGYTGLHARTMLESITGLPTMLENDANAAAVGEAEFGAGKGLEHFVFICYGTGVGGAVMMNGQLYRGSCFSAGEIGGLITHPEAMVPGEVGTGSYERYASVTALVRAAGKMDAALINGKEIFRRREEPAVQEVVQLWLREVAAGIISLNHVFNPQAIVIGGGVMEQPWVREQLEQLCAQNTKQSFRDMKLLSARLGNRAGLFGAGWLAQKL